MNRLSSYVVSLKCDEAIAGINKWAAESTKGHIKRLLSRPSVNELTYLVLANALYFNGTWASPFDDRFTSSGIFHLLDGETVRVDLMTKQVKMCLYGSFDGYKVVQLPYKIGKDEYRRFSMNFFLPDVNDGLPDLLEHISSDHAFFTKKLKLDNQLLGRLAIPKFKFSYELNVKDAMAKLGFDLPLSLSSEMQLVESEDGSRLAQEIELGQMSCIEVNEKGTEAAAVMFNLRGEGCLPPVPSFVADHPFLFVHKEDMPGTVFFIGAVFNPLLSHTYIGC